MLPIALVSALREQIAVARSYYKAIVCMPAPA